MYRYIEHLVELTVFRKYGYKKILEIGPGTDSFFKYMGPKDRSNNTMIDYSDEILEFNRNNLPTNDLECINIDITSQESIEALKRKWDYIVANSILEHLEDDKRFVNNMYELLDDGGMIVCSTDC